MPIARGPAPTFALALLLLAVAACGGRQAEMPGLESGDGGTAVLEVDNQANLDMTIYAVRSAGDRVRLGTATAHVSTRFTIPAELLFGNTSLRFQADPIGGRRAPVSHTITVAPGDTVVMRIPPH